jgi:hypothetical protein
MKKPRKQTKTAKKPRLRVWRKRAIMGMSKKALFERLDKIIFLLETVAQQPSLLVRLFNGIAMGAGILGILSVVDVIKSWLGG